MSSRPLLPEPANRARQRDEDAQYYREVLHQLIDIGTDLAEAIHRQATAERAPKAIDEAAGQPAAPPTPSPDHTIAFDRIARSVRRTIALACKLSEPDGASPPARKHLVRGAEDTIRRSTRSTEAEALSAERPDRPDSPDLDDDFDRELDEDLDEESFAAAIANIRDDLGLAASPGSELRKPGAPSDVRDLRARAIQQTPGAVPPVDRGSVSRQTPAQPAAAPPQSIQRSIQSGAGPPPAPP